MQRASSPAPSEDLRTADGPAVLDTEADDRPMNGAQVVDRVVDILDAFRWLGPQLGVSELSRALGLKKATTHRILASLRRRDMVAQDPATRRYRLGIKLWELGQMATSQVDWTQRVKPYLERLTEETGETTHLAVLDDGEVLYVDKVETSRSLRMPSQVGRRLPAHCTGVGKALIAYLEDRDIGTILERRGMRRFTAHTKVEPDELLRDLAEVRRRGYSVDDEEIEDGLRCIGAPVRDHSGRVVAAVSIAGPSSRLRPEDVAEQGARVVHAARAMSAALGCQPDVYEEGQRSAPPPGRGMPVDIAS